MNADVIQTLRYKLQKRVRRLNSTGFELFHYTLKQFWGFLQGEPLIVGILEQLDAQREQVATNVDQRLFREQKAIVYGTELDNAIMCYLVIKRCAESDDTRIEMNVGRLYTGETKYNEMLEAFRAIVLDPFYEYLDEHIDYTGLLLSLLVRYKHRCEWFHRARLYSVWERCTSRGEKQLALDLYEYLFEQGINFFIEPVSASGEADLVAAQTGDQPLIANAKIFNPQRGQGKNYIARGFRQIYSYTLDYNEKFGFLVIFKTSEEDLHIAIPEQTGKVPYLLHNGKAIFFLTVDLYPHPSASKRDILKSVQISAEDLIRWTGEDEPTHS